MSMYLLQGKLTAKAGRAEELAGILLEASKLVSTAKDVSFMWLAGSRMIRTPSTSPKSGKAGKTMTIR